MSMSKLTQLNPDSQEFVNWLKTPGFRPPKATVLHHTWSPAATDYAGRQTIANIRTYHMDTLNWSDIGANAYACPDGTVVTGRPLDVQNWCHAYISRDTPEAELAAVWGGNRQYLNYNGFGIETVANFDYEKPYGDGKAAHSFETALRILTAVHKVFNIPVNMLFFHRDAEYKSCPGTLLSRATVRQELSIRLNGIVPEVNAPKVVLDGQEIDCEPKMEWDERMTLEGTPFLQALGIDPALAGGIIHASGRAYVSELKKLCASQGWYLAYREMTQGPRLYPKRIA